MNHAKVTLDRNGQPTQTLKEELVAADQLVRDPGAPRASVSFTLGRAFGYGELKVSAMCTLQCAQDEETLEEASKRAYFKTFEMLTDGISLMSKQLEAEEAERKVAAGR